MNTATKAWRLLLVAAIWLTIIGGGAAGYWYWWKPHHHESIIKATSSDSTYRTQVHMLGDAFSGYAVLRSDVFQKNMKAESIKVNFEDDKADYLGRIKALADNKAQMAVFTIDALLKVGSQIGDFPASIVFIVDESYGDDGIVAYKDAVPTPCG